MPDRVSFNTRSLPAPTRSLLENELYDGETLLWGGRPKLWTSVQHAGWPPLAFVLFGAAFTCFGFVVRNGDDRGAWLFFVGGLGVVALGVWLSVREGFATYLITDQRVAIVRRRIEKTTTRSYWATGRPVWITADPHGRTSGDLCCFVGGESDTPPLVFIGIDDVTQVKRLVTELFTCRRVDPQRAFCLDTMSLPDPLADALRRDLPAGESVAWCAQPSPTAFGKRYRGQQAFGLGGFTFTLFSMSFGFEGELGVATIGFGLLSVFTLTLAASPYWTRLIATGCVYGASQSRAVSIAPHIGFWPICTRSFGADELCLIERCQHRDGSGDLLFRDEVAMERSDDGPLHATTGFYGLPDVRAAEQTLLRIQDPG